MFSDPDPDADPDPLDQKILQYKILLISFGITKKWESNDVNFLVQKCFSRICQKMFQNKALLENSVDNC